MKRKINYSQGQKIGWKEEWKRKLGLRERVRVCGGGEVYRETSKEKGRKGNRKGKKGRRKTGRKKALYTSSVKKRKERKSVGKKRKRG